MSLRTAAFALALSAGAPGAAAAAPPTVELTREGGVFRLQAAFDVQAPPAEAWAVLTDYDGMTRFIPSLRQSRVISRAPDGIVIEQEGLIRLLIFSRRVPMTLKVVERPPDRIEFAAVGSSDFEDYDGAWTVSPSSAPCRVTYELFAEMKESLVPHSLARRILEKSIRSQLGQVQAEIERRVAGHGAK